MTRESKNRLACVERFEKRQEKIQISLAEKKIARGAINKFQSKNKKMKLDFKDQRANVDEFHVATAMAATRMQ